MRFDTTRDDDVFNSVIRDKRRIKVEARQTLVERPSAAVPLGTAPDGLPIVLNVIRRAGVRLPVLDTLGLTEDDLPPELEQALAALEHAAARYAKSRGVEVIESALCYRSQRGVRELMGNTLLSQAIGSQSPLKLDGEERPPNRGASRAVITSAMPLAPHPEEVLVDVRGSANHLALSMEGNEVLVVRFRDDELIRSRPLAFENLSSFDSPAFHVRDEVGIEETFPFEDTSKYAKSVRQASVVGWSVSDEDLTRAIAQLSRRVHALHRSGRVHGDLKPANVLIGHDGARPFDDLGVKVGELSFAATPGWAAPEQVLARPVTAGSDVYALGLVLAKVLGAVIHGEERSFIIPSGGESRRRVRLLSEPQVFIDPTTAEIDEPFLKAWEALVRTCVTFDLERRLGDANELADRIDQLLIEAPPKKRRWLNAGPGRLHRDVDYLGQRQPCWILDDGDLI